MKAKLRSLENASARKDSAKKSRKAPVVDARLQQALDLQRDGSQSEAEALFVELLDEQPRNPAALYSLAAIFQNRGQSTEALELINRCLAVVPHFQQAHQAREAILKAQRSAAGAPSQRSPLESLPTGSSSKDPRVALALQRQGQGHGAEARALFEAVLAQEPRDFVCLYSLCILAMQ
ncbi:MAG: hypothetical protein EB072_14460, partial [Betaproteobacteria bacterium]|nr:hypothetical protein [Betaproteobacteria bacterium]